MSTIRHSVQIHTWYAAAAAALAVGLLAVLMTTVFTRTSGAPAPAVPIPVQAHGGAPYHAPCFAGHPGNPIELARSGCRTATP
jgi:hypothetical protein